MKFSRLILISKKIGTDFYVGFIKTSEPELIPAPQGKGKVNSCTFTDAYFEDSKEITSMFKAYIGNIDGDVKPLIELMEVPKECELVLFRETTSFGNGFNVQFAFDSLAKLRHEGFNVQPIMVSEK